MKKEFSTVDPSKAWIMLLEVWACVQKSLLWVYMYLTEILCSSMFFSFVSTQRDLLSFEKFDIQVAVA